MSWMIDLYQLYKLLERWYTGVPRLFNSGRALPPLQMVFELTYRCNLRCPMCYQRRQEKLLGVSHGKASQELDLEAIKGIIDQTPPWALIIFTGGEIFVRKDILSILEYASRKRRCHIVTNGTLISDETARALVEMGLLSIGFSIDGNEKIHDRMRGSGTFAKAFETMKVIHQMRSRNGRRFPLLNIKTTITQDNVGVLTDLIDVGREVEAEYCTLQIMNTSLCTSGMYFHETLDPYLSPPPPITDFDVNLLRSQLEIIESRSADQGPVVRVSPALTPSQIVSHYANAFDIRQYFCTAPWSGINVSPYGDVYPCFNYRIGSLRQSSLGELWNNERYRAFRRSLRKNGLFPGCVGCCDLI
jgi:MoaA/NifB/PqqE/SkfB family radical SAM enzyme